MRTVTDLIVIHCTATRANEAIDIETIDRWHKKRGWKMVGYHGLVLRNGALQAGRRWMDVGAHAYGYNTRSVGIALAGGIGPDGTAENNFTKAQWDTLDCLVALCKVAWPTAQVVGHRDLSPDIDGDGVIEKWEWVKECPSFDAAKRYGGSVNGIA